MASVSQVPVPAASAASQVPVLAASAASQVPIFILHAPHLAVRRAMCEQLLNQYLANDHAEYIESNSPEDVARMPLSELVDLKPVAEAAEEPLWAPRSINLPALSSYLKHLEAWKRIAADTSNTWHLVLEDDVCFTPSVRELLDEALRTVAEAQADVCFLGFPVPEEAFPKGAHWIQTGAIYKVLPGCDAYLMRASGARRLLESGAQPMRFVTNVHLSWMIATGRIRAAMFRSAVFTEGSKLGTYVSALQVNNALIYNPEFRELFHIAHVREALTEEQRAAAAAAWERTPFQGHPDMIYMWALVHVKEGRLREARVWMDRAYEAYTRNRCLMNRDSVFLNNYIQLCKVEAPAALAPATASQSQSQSQ